MSIPQYHTIYNNDIQYNYMLFNSVNAFNGFVDQEAERLNYSNQNIWKLEVIDADLRIQEGTEWYGTPAPNGVMDLEKHTYFLGMHLIKKLQPKIQSQLAQYLEYLNSNVMPKPKLDYNDRNLGMFSFDRAAMGLFRLNSVNIDSPIDRTTSQLKIELGRSDVNTKVKKVFAFFRDKNISLPSMRLYIMAGANGNVQGNEMLYVGLACSELVSFLEQRGVAVEVNILIGTTFNKTVNMGVVKVKRFEENLDKNQLLLMSSDPKYFRYRGFKALIALSNRFGLTIPEGLGSIQPRMGKDFVPLMNKQGFVFEQSYSLATAAKEVNRIIETYNQQIKDAKRA
jgi:hypothetical protein